MPETVEVATVSQRELRPVSTRRFFAQIRVRTGSFVSEMTTNVIPVEEDVR
jgi:hypothetical protein